MQKYRFRRYRKEYPLLYSKEARLLQRLLERGTQIEHVGSTSVPGLGGKGIIDVAAGVRSLSGVIDRLQEGGYEFRAKASTSKRLFFRRDYQTGGRIQRVHVHVMQSRSKELKEMVAFSQFLRRCPDEALKYARLKREAVGLGKGDGAVYKRHKEKFIQKKSREDLD